MVSVQKQVSVPKVTGFGIVGGILGAIVMGGIAYMMPIPNTGGAPFFVALAMMMGAGGMAVVGGWILHLAIGVIVGVLFGAIVAKWSRLRPSSATRGIALGILGGIVWWVIAFVPAMATAMPSLMTMGIMIVGSFVAHAIYGLILGGVVGALLARATA